MNERGLSARLKSYHVGFDALPASAVVLDQRGVIIDTNAAWRLFERLEQAVPGTTGAGVSYLDVCDRARSSDPVAGEVADALRAILAGTRSAFAIEYSCHSPIGDRWFVMRASTAPADQGSGAVVVHLDITFRKILESGVHNDGSFRDRVAVPDESAALRALNDALMTTENSTGVGIVLATVENFTDIVSECGESVGRDTLAHLASRASRMLRSGDALFVMDRDAMMLILPGIEQRDLLAVGERLEEVLTAPLQLGADEFGFAVRVATHTALPQSDAATEIADARASMLRDSRPHGTTSHLRDRRKNSPSAPSVYPSDELTGELTGEATDELTGEAATNYLDDPSVRAVVANLSHIDGQKVAEEAVRFQAKLLDVVGQPVIVTDPNSHVLFWNPAAEKTYGWSEAETLGKPLSSILPAPASWTDRVDRIRSTQHLGNSWSGECELVVKGGATIPVSVTTSPLLDEHGNLVATIGVSMDLSERNRADQATAHLSAIIESSNDAISSISLEGTVLSWNRAAARLFGYEADEIIGKSIELLAPEQRRGGANQLLETIAEGGSVTNYETVRRRSDGSTFDASISLSPVRDRNDQVVAVAVIARDISDQVKASAELKAERSRLANAQAAARLGSFEINLETGAVDRSDELWRILGSTPDPELGVDFESIHPNDRDAVVSALGRAFAGERDVEVVHRIVRPDGETRWVLSRTAHHPGAAGGLVAGTMLDITEQYEAEQALQHLAYHDTLTGLPNRASLESTVRDQLPERESFPRRIAVASINLDDFKKINDSLGRGVGDAVLVKLAQRLRKMLPPTDFLARSSGDEFVVTRSAVGNLQDCGDLGAHIFAAFEDPIRVDQREVQISASIGIALSYSGCDAETVLQHADAAMHHAKSAGRNRFFVYNDVLRASEKRQKDVSSALDDALPHGQFRLVFQPILELESERVLGFESLLRWVHPTMGAIGPDEFVPIAEQTGLIVPIGRWVLEESLQQLAIWRSTAAPGLEPWISVNLSALQVEDPDIVTHVAVALQRAGLPGDALHLELTETTLMENLRNARECLEELRHMGISISIDDFGTGYSSLSYLKLLPIDVLKIDRSFVGGIETNAGDRSIVAAILQLAQSRDVEVIAEGIETVAQRELLMELGCQSGQGFLWSPGLNAIDASKWLPKRS